MTVLAATSWRTNAHLIVACAELGYLRKEWVTLDPTYGYGTFWNLWRPDMLVASDLDKDKSPVGVSFDFRRLLLADRSFDAVVFDPPYKLNGTPSGPDERYGVDKVASWQERMQLIRDGLDECARVLAGGYLLLKCQDQVCSGQKRWQTIDFAIHGANLGLRLVDRLDMLVSPRPQPAGRRQVHAQQNYSTLLVFQRSKGV